MLDQNLDRLDESVMDLLAFAKTPLTTWFEIRLDDPVGHLINGGEGLIQHFISGNPQYLHHRGEAGWAIVDSESISGDEARGRMLALSHIKLPFTEKTAAEALPAGRAVELP